jgi:gluconolactonase
MKYILSIVCLSLLTACDNIAQQQKSSYKTIGSIERLDPALDAIIDTGAKVEIIAEGYEWSEGPLWVEKYNMLLFSDVPKNTVYKWTEAKGAEVYLAPSGYTDTVKRGGETGSNGLLLDPKGNLVLCQHGNRQMARMNSTLDNPKPDFVTLAGKYKGQRFNSPNDAAFNSAGELFFTDPPYGLVKQNDSDPNKETKWNGVYKVKKNGEVILLTDSITRPNGIAFLPGEKKLIVANSDPFKPNWYIFDIVNDSLKNGKIFYTTKGLDKPGRGLPDGFKVDKKGNIFASGAGGIWILNSEGKPLGRIRLTESASNTALSADQKTLYVTNDMYVLRVKMRP